MIEHRFRPRYAGRFEPQLRDRLNASNTTAGLTAAAALAFLGFVLASPPAPIAEELLGTAPAKPAAATYEPCAKAQPELRPCRTQSAVLTFAAVGDRVRLPGFVVSGLHPELVASGLKVPMKVSSAGAAQRELVRKQVWLNIGGRQVAMTRSSATAATVWATKASTVSLTFRLTAADRRALRRASGHFQVAVAGLPGADGVKNIAVVRSRVGQQSPVPEFF